MVFLKKNLWLRSFGALWFIECKLFVRQPTAAFFTFAFPILLFVLFGSIYGQSPMWDRPNVRYIDFYAPALIAAYIGQAGLVNLMNFIGEYRLVGILKRYVVSPIPLGFYLCVHTAMQVTLFIFSILLLIVIGELVFDLNFRGHWAIVLFVGSLGLSCFFALGFLLSGLYKSPRSIHALGNVLFLAMFFISGAAFPKQLFPHWLKMFSRASPLTHVVEVFSGIWLGDSVFQYTHSLLFLFFVTVLAYTISIRTFKWEV